jgi:TetR/AcrR family transcriptional regulator, regulator of mycofactocin system
LTAEPLAHQVRAKRSEMITLEVESVALRLFEERGFTEVTVDEIASSAQISTRTFYRYFASKEDVLQVRIDMRSRVLQTALAARRDDEPPMESIRVALQEGLAVEDMAVLRRWIAVVAGTPSALKSVVGGVQLKTHRVMAEFFASRLGLSSQDLVPVTLAAAAGGVLQATLTYWFIHGGDLVATMSKTFKILENRLDQVAQVAASEDM